MTDPEKVNFLSDVEDEAKLVASGVEFACNQLVSILESHTLTNGIELSKVANQIIREAVVQGSWSGYGLLGIYKVLTTVELYINSNWAVGNIVSHVIATVAKDILPESVITDYIVRIEKRNILI